MTAHLSSHIVINLVIVKVKKYTKMIMPKLNIALIIIII